MKSIFSLKITAIVFWFLLILYSCNTSVPEKNFVGEVIPELVLTDSIVVDRLTEFILLDVQEDRSNFLLYDWKTKEMINLSPSGEIKAIANLNGDGKNSYQEVVGGPEFNELSKKYKSKSFYQIFKEEEKIWEGKWDINLKVRRNLIYSNAKLGKDPNAVEKDVQTLYFYEIR